MDFVGEMTASLYGHSHPRLQHAIILAVQDIGLNLGATTAYEQRYAALICKRFELDWIRFTNSGTEAGLHCLAAARRFTNKKKIIVFRGGYHGSVLSFPSEGAPNNVSTEDYILVQFNDAVGVKAAFSENQDIAAVIVEPMQGNGAISATQTFLRTIREETTKVRSRMLRNQVVRANQRVQAGAIFILDEVQTSRLSVGGLKKVLDITPDLITMGKYLGGGMPFGAFGGRKDIMSVYDPSSPGSMIHNGTFQNNTIMLNAGYVGLSEVYTPEAVEMLNQRGENMRHKLEEIFRGTKFSVLGRGSLMCIHATKTGLQPSQITCRKDITDVDELELRRLFWLEMLNQGFWVHPRGSIALNLQIPNDAIASFLEAVTSFCNKHEMLIAVQ